MSSEDHKSKPDVKFDSFNIGRKEKVDYFSKNQPKPRKKVSEWKIFKGKNKFITLGIVAGVILITGLFVYFVIYLPNQEEEATPEEIAYVESLYDIYDGASNAAGEHGENIATAVVLINDYASKREDPSQKFETLMLIPTLYWQFGMNEQALNYAASMDATGVDEERLSEYYSTLSVAYRNMGDYENAKKYEIMCYQMMNLPEEYLDQIETEYNSLINSSEETNE